MELKTVRDELTRDYSASLSKSIALGKEDDKTRLLADEVEKLADTVKTLRAALEAAQTTGHDLEEKLVAKQAECDLLAAERDAAKREAREAKEEAERALKEKDNEEETV